MHLARGACLRFLNGLPMSCPSEVSILGECARAVDENNDEISCTGYTHDCAGASCTDDWDGITMNGLLDPDCQ